MARSSSRAAPELRADGVEHLLGYLLAVAEVSTRQVFQQAVGQPYGLRPVEFTLLVLLRDNGRASPRQIALALRMPAPHVTTLVDRLAKRDLVQRVPDPDDGRAVQVVLTAAGRKLTEHARQVSLKMEDALQSALTPAERTRLRALLLKLVRAAPSA
jgi:DNA-binding MarR family transcriptional regulator